MKACGEETPVLYNPVYPLSKLSLSISKFLRGNFTISRLRLNFNYEKFIDMNSNICHRTAQFGSPLILFQIKVY